MDREQRDIFERYGAKFTPSERICKIGISESALSDGLPLRGLRHRPESGTTGWFIWAGEWSDDPDFIKPLHWHQYCPAVLPFLALPLGWRFLVAPGYGGVWFDCSCR
jgi:hypothetical protein